MLDCFFDTHCHLDFSEFSSELDDILLQCERRGVAAIAVPGVREKYWSRVISLCAKSAELYCALGLHPCFLQYHRSSDLEMLRQYVHSGVCSAVGEIGLDFWQGTEEAEPQLLLFEAQLDIAQDAQLPVLLHVRKAHDQVLKLLRRYRLARAGIVHAFSGSQQQADQYIQLGFKLGVGGAITYPRAQRLRKIVSALPLDSMVLETDAPDMPLCGRQGMVNRPDYIPDIFSELASIRQESAEVLKLSLWENSLRVFDLEDKR